MVTDKNKEQFEKWFNEYAKDIEYLCYSGFGDGMFPDSDYLNEAPFEMQIGVYLAYYDSLDMLIDLKVDDAYGNQFSWSIIYDYEYEADIFYYTRNEAYKEAFKKANDLINNK